MTNEEIYSRLMSLRLRLLADGAPDGDQYDECINAVLYDVALELGLSSDQASRLARDSVGEPLQPLLLAR